MYKRLLGICVVLMLWSIPAWAQVPEADYRLVPTPGISNVFLGALDAADFDNDGDLDVLLTGASDTRLWGKVYRYEREDQTISPQTGRVFRTAVYSDVTAALLDGVWLGAGRWVDYNNDGDLDVILTGSLSLTAPFQPLTKIYTNDAGAFLEQPDVSSDLIDVYNSALDWGDYDGDGDPDLALAGFTGTERVTRVYESTGGRFVDTGMDLPGVEKGSLDWGDYDGDGDLDLALSGVSTEGPITKVFRNDDGILMDIDADLPGVFYGTAAWGDYDLDNDLDLLISGGVFAPTIVQGVTRIYQNDGGQFTQADVRLPGLANGTASWGDYDVDGDLDVLLVGPEDILDAASVKAKVFENEAGTFRQVGEVAGVILGNAMWFDYGSNGKLDIFTTGLIGGSPTTTLYRVE